MRQYLGTGNFSHIHEQQQQQQQPQSQVQHQSKNVDWAGRTLRKHSRRYVSPTRKEQMGDVLTKPQLEIPKPFRRQFQSEGRDIRFASYGSEAKGMPLNSAAYQLSAGESHTASHWKTSTQASIYDKEQASHDDFKKTKGKKIVRPAFENAVVRLRQERHQDLLLGNRKKKANGPTNFLDSIYASVARSTAGLKPRPITHPGQFTTLSHNTTKGNNHQTQVNDECWNDTKGGINTRKLNDQIQRASQFISPTVQRAARSAALSPRKKASTLQHRIW